MTKNLTVAKFVAGAGLALSSLAFAQPAQADSQYETYSLPNWEVGVGGGGYFFDGGSDEWNPGQIYQLRVAYYVDPTWSIEGYIAGMPHFEDDTGRAAHDDNWGGQGGLDANYHFNDDASRQWDPFIGLGGGAQGFGRKVNGDKWHGIASVNAGLAYRVDPQWSLRGEYKALWQSGDDPQLNQIGLVSVGYAWGGERREATSERKTSERKISEEGKMSTIENRDVGLKTVYFDYDSSSLRADAKETLRSNADWMKRNPDTKIILEGHCDERGTNEYNMALGERRARAAYNYLVSLGVSTAQVTTISYGEERPADAGHSEEAWAKNRRVECRGNQ